LKVITVVVNDEKQPPDIFILNHAMNPEEAVFILMEAMKNLAIAQAKEEKKNDTKPEGLEKG